MSCAEPVRASMSAAEERRAARNRKILQNREARLQRILGPNSAEEARRIVSSSSNESDPVLPEEFLTHEFIRKVDIEHQKNGSNSVNTIHNEHKNGSSKQISKRYHSNLQKYLSLIIMMIGLSLPMFTLNYYLIYFFVLEMTFFIYFQEIPVPETSPTIVFTLLMIMGLNNQHIARIKLISRLFRWIFKDFSIFFLSCVSSLFLREQIKNFL